MKRILLVICALGMLFTVQAQRVYINPGHGDWGSEKIIPIAQIASKMRFIIVYYFTVIKNSSPLVLVYAIFPSAT